MLHSFCLKTSSEPAPVTKQKLLGQISATLSSHSYSRFHPGILTGPMFDMWQDLLIDLVPVRRKKVQTKTVTPSSRQGLSCSHSCCSSRLQRTNAGQENPECSFSDKKHCASRGQGRDAPVHNITQFQSASCSNPVCDGIKRALWSKTH